MSFFEVYLIGLAGAVGFFSLIWVISLIVKDSSIVDMVWGAGFVVISGIYVALTDGYETRRLLILALVAIWGLRLSLHIFFRNRGKGEDFRYQKWREQYGARYWWVSYFQVYLLQGVILWAVSVPLLAAVYHHEPTQLTALDFLGVGVWLIGFMFEAGGDWQLMRFKANPANKGKLLTTGFWAWTRHPNYFGDAAAWWGYYLVALSTPGGFLTAIGPLVMTFLLVRVSGVAMLERGLKKSKPGFEDYVQNTPAFFPRPPRKTSW